MSLEKIIKFVFPSKNILEHILLDFIPYNVEITTYIFGFLEGINVWFNNNSVKGGNSGYFKPYTNTFS